MFFNRSGQGHRNIPGAIEADETYTSAARQPQAIFGHPLAQRLMRDIEPMVRDT